MLADHGFAAAYPIGSLQSWGFHLQNCKQVITYQLHKAFR